MAKAPGLTATRNPNPPVSVYPKSELDAPYSISEQYLRSAIFIPETFTYGKKPPVILFPGTGSTGFLAFSGNFIPLLSGADWADPVWHLFVVRHPQRDALLAKLAEASVGSLIHYPIPPHKQAAYAEARFAPAAFPLASRMAEEVLSMPIGPHQGEAQTRAVIDALLK